MEEFGKLKELVGESFGHVYRYRKLGVEGKRNTRVVCYRFCERNGNGLRKKREVRVKAVEEHGYYHIKFLRTDLLIDRVSPCLIFISL